MVYDVANGGVIASLATVDVSGNAVFTSVTGSVTLVSPVLGTPASGILTNCTGLPAAGIVAGTLASGMTLVAPALGTPASGVLTNCTGLPSASIVAGTMASGMVLVAPALGTPASGTLTNCTFPTLNQSTTGTAGGLTGTPAITVGAITATSVTGSSMVQGATVTSTGGLNAGTTKFAVNSSGLATEYNSIALTGNGIPTEVGIVTTGTATAAISATSLLAAPVAAGFYRISAYLKVTVATSSPVAGAITLTYVDKDTVAQSVVMQGHNASGSTATQTGSTTTTPWMGDTVIWCNSGTAIKYAIAFSGTGTYEYNFKVEAL